MSVTNWVRGAGRGLKEAAEGRRLLGGRQDVDPDAELDGGALEEAADIGRGAKPELAVVSEASCQTHGPGAAAGAARSAPHRCSRLPVWPKGVTLWGQRLLNLLRTPRSRSVGHLQSCLRHAGRGFAGALPRAVEGAGHPRRQLGDSQDGRRRGVSRPWAGAFAMEGAYRSRGPGGSATRVEVNMALVSAALWTDDKACAAAPSGASAVRAQATAPALAALGWAQGMGPRCSGLPIWRSRDEALESAD